MAGERRGLRPYELHKQGELKAASILLMRQERSLTAPLRHVCLISKMLAAFSLALLVQLVRAEAPALTCHADNT